jgi:hypothetical protein
MPRAPAGLNLEPARPHQLDGEHVAQRRPGPERAVTEAIWRYARDSTRWVFGDSLGDPTADDIWALAKERTHGINRTEVRDLFSRNKKAREIDRALTALVDAGRLQQTHGHDRTTGRPAEIWIPVPHAA